MSETPPSGTLPHDPEDPSGRGASPLGTRGERPGLIARVIRFCLENKLVVFLVAGALFAGGLVVAPFDWDLGPLPRKPVPTDAIPDIGENQQIVFTSWMGRSPRDVDDQITYPLTVSLLGIPGVKTVRSYSMFGFSTIYIIFNEDVEFYWTRSRVLEKLNSLPPDALPEGVKPMLGPDATALGQIYWYTLEGRDPDGKPAGGWDPWELRSIQDWYVRYYLLASTDVEGNKPIAEVASVGGFVKEYQVDVDPDAMRAAHVTLDDVFNAVRMSNVDVGARTIEINRVEYVIRGRGFLTGIGDVENTVIKVNENVPIYIKDVATVSLGPALRRGALDKDGAEAVGGVVVVRYGANPLSAIAAVKDKIEKVKGGLPERAVVDFTKVSADEIKAFADARAFEAFADGVLNETAWREWLKGTPREQWPKWITLSKVTIVSFYDRTGLIHETLGTLNEALTLEILVTIIVVVVMVLHLRSSLLISGALPLAVLMCFIAMKLFGVDANIVALSGIAIAIGTLVDMSIIICENILKHVEAARPDEPPIEVVYRASAEVGSAVLTAVLTTVVGFLPVFALTGAEGKLFKPLAFTKTFALGASVLVALLLVPSIAQWLLAGRIRNKTFKRVLLAALTVVGAVTGFLVAWWLGLIVMLLGAWGLAHEAIPRGFRRVGPWTLNAVAAVIVGTLLVGQWLPLGPEIGFAKNFIFVAVLVGGLLGFFRLFQWVYPPVLRGLLKGMWVTLPVLLALSACLVLFGLYVWVGPALVWGPIDRVAPEVIPQDEVVERLTKTGVFEDHGGTLVWTNKVLAGNDIDKAREGVRAMLDKAGVDDVEALLDNWTAVKQFIDLGKEPWKVADGGRGIKYEPFATKVRWTLARTWSGLGKEFMPDLDEGSFLYMPTTSPHASIGEVLDVIRKQDSAIQAIPEVESVVGKLGRADTPLDPAPVNMIETIINYRSEYISDESGRRVNYRLAESGKPYLEDKSRTRFAMDGKGDLIEDPNGRPFRQWRPQIRSKEDIWDEIVSAAQIPGTTSAPKLQPIAARIVMLQSGMRAPMGVKVKGPDLETIQAVGIEIERYLKEVPSVRAPAVSAERIVGKPYLEIHIDRQAAARYGISIRRVQDVIEVAIGGRPVTKTVEGRERYTVRVRYQRELRDSIETLDEVLVPAPDGTQIPLKQIAEIEYVAGPQAIKSEDTFLIGYVIFDKKPGFAEVEVVEQCEAYLKAKRASGEFTLPKGVDYEFAGSYQNQLRAQKTLYPVLGIALFFIFIILYFQFRSVLTTFLVFSGILVAWAGGFGLIWCYNQPWFLDFGVFGVGMRDLFGVHTINMSVAVWVGFLALFGIASDNGVVIATFLDQSFRKRTPASIKEIRDATVAGAARRIRPCLMTSATTILALLPVLASTGRGSDVMVPMAIPSFGGMMVVLLSVFLVPVLYCAIQEIRFHLFGPKSPPPA